MFISERAREGETVKVLAAGAENGKSCARRASRWVRLCTHPPRHLDNYSVWHWKPAATSLLEQHPASLCLPHGVRGHSATHTQCTRCTNTVTGSCAKNVEDRCILSWGEPSQAKSIEGHPQQKGLKETRKKVNGRLMASKAGWKNPNEAQTSASTLTPCHWSSTLKPITPE